MTAPLLDVQDLRVAFPGRGFRSKPIEVLHGVSLDIAAGETLGVVGESGSGKTTIGRAVLGLVKPSGGRITFDGQDVTHAAPKDRRGSAQDIQVVFQDPYTSLNPSMQIGDILSEPLVVRGASQRDARARVRTLLDQVGLPANAAERLPREFSGGQRQRVAIARALAPEPRLIVCDEPVSALDLSTQAKVLDLFIEIQRSTGVAYLFVSHDLAVVRHISHRVSVVYRGDIVETGSADAVTSTPENPYTQRLLLAAPVADPAEQERRRAQRRQLEAAASGSTAA
ncbi:ATP-binding cassette domain-containing protein [Modestobacter roseus]|uniref:Peptide/nickel transport system ATP-binding protein n=1 Tax=Modestobacter roseus TaxID=1181884 RepID=A0A562IMV3_9ACTN|nr:ATP-binding cassette domain-containing protein [Modestobacter roseus]MQA33762.1 ATP-binding cassette domain-containing protein [Modestobacter roseus]TWH72055.1 peptide/nickel transport system ATP-binding protein [Modestobacter roseus]